MSEELESKEKVRESVRLSSSCETCGKTKGRTIDSALTSWIFSSKNCTCKSINLSHESPESIEEESCSSASNPNREVDESILAELRTRFEDIEYLGGGGMGSVYKAFDTDLGSTVAVKILDPSLSRDAEAVKRFDIESETISKLNHHGIVNTYGSGKTSAGVPFLIMEYAEGEDLRRFLSSGRKLEEKIALGIFEQIAEALLYAHGEGVLHRDLKPANVIVSEVEDGEFSIKIVDFGLAKVMPTVSGARDTQNLTQTGEVFGSPMYMSPEQCMGFRINEKSDIYSFGCLMYEVLTGEPPFKASNPIQIVVQQISDEPEPWSSSKKRSLKGLEALVFKCLAKEQVDRYQTVEELLSDLRKLRLGKKIKEFPRTATPKAVLSPMQSITLFGTAIGLWIYWSLVTSFLPDISSIVFSMALPFISWATIRHLKKYGTSGSAWKQWKLLLFFSLLALSFTAIPVMIGNTRFFYELPLSYQIWYYIAFLVHLMVIPIALATRVGAFFCEPNKRVEFKSTFLTFMSTSAALIVICFLPRSLFFLLLSPNIPSALIGSPFMQISFPTRTLASTIVAEKVSPWTYEIPEMKGEALVQLHQYPEAIASLTTALRRSPEFNVNDVLELRASAYLGSGEVESALLDINEALRITSDSCSRYSYDYQLAPELKQKGDILMAKRDFKGALKSYDESFKLVPIARYGIESVYEGRSVAKWALGDREGAIQDLSKLIGIRAQEGYDLLHPDTHVRRAILYEQIGDFDKARKDLTLAAELSEAENLHQKPTFIHELFMPVYGNSDAPASNENRAELAQAFALMKIGEFEKASRVLRDNNLSNNDKKEFLRTFRLQTGIDFDWKPATAD